MITAKHALMRAYMNRGACEREAARMAEIALDELWLAGWHVVATPVLEETPTRTFLDDCAHPTTELTLRTIVNDTVVAHRRREYNETLNLHREHIVGRMCCELATAIYEHVKETSPL